jgi:phage protein D
MAPTSSSFLVDIDGSPLAADAKALLLSAVVDDSLRLPDFFLLRFRDPDRLVITKSGAKIGSKVKVSVTSDATPGPQQLIEGEITALEAEYDATGTYTVIRGYDQANRLLRGRRTESYTQSTASDVATKVAQRAGLSIGEVESTSTVYEHLSQGGVTDWEFLDGLAREIGFEIVVKDGKFDFRKPKKADTAPEGGGGPEQQNPLVLRLGTDLLRFRSLITAAEQVKEVQARGWDLAQKKAFVATAPATTTSAVLAAYNPVDIAKKFGDPIYVATDVAYRSQAEVDTAAAAIAEQIAGAFAEFEGVARGNPKLHAGAAISVDNVGAPFDGKYTITSSHHRYDPNTGYTTTFSVTGRSERSLYGLANGGGTAKLGQGPVVAQVSDAKDPLEQARVKLTFPWLSDTYVSDWARTVQPGAGKDRGALVLPEVGDEVLVLFEQGDIRRPYVLGGLYNGVDTARPDRRQLRSDQPALVRLPPGPPDRPDRSGRPHRGHHPVHHRRQAATEDGLGRHQDHRAQRRQDPDRGQGRRDDRLRQQQAGTQGRRGLHHLHRRRQDRRRQRRRRRADQWAAGAQGHHRQAGGPGQYRGQGRWRDDDPGFPGEDQLIGE